MKAAILARLDKVKGPDSKGEHQALCPFHEDRNPSLSINFDKGCYYCQGCQSSGPLSRLAERLGVNVAMKAERQEEAVYDYPDAEGRLLYQVVRYHPKDFRQRRPDGAGGWVYDLKGVKRVLYHLPEVLEAVAKGQTVYIVEGEKDADALRGLGLVATTNPGGAGKWKPEYSDSLTGASVVILPDKDEPGRSHAENVCQSLLGRVASVKVLELPGLPDKGDVTDWLHAGGTKEELEALIAAPPERKPSSQTSGLVCIANVEPEKVEWLWHPYIPLNKQTLMEGDPGEGKSYGSLAIATGVSTGKGLPGKDPTEPANVVIASAEDGLGDTIRPRLDAMGANINRIFAIKDALDFGKGDLAILESYLREVDPRLVVIDPLVAYIGAGVDIHRANETRAIMAQLADIAERYRVAILAVRHLTKGSASKPIYRGLGSIDLAAACRSVLMVGHDPDNPQKRAIVHIKSNLAPLGPAMGYELRNGTFYWTGLSDLTWQRILQAEGVEDKTLRDDAVDFLRDELRNGPVEAAQILKDAKDAGLSDITLRRAKTSLKIVSRRQGEPGRRGGGKYLWELSDLGDHTDLVEHLNQSTLKIETLRTTDDHLNTPVIAHMDLGDQGEHLNTPVVTGKAALILSTTDFLEVSRKGERL